MTNSTNKTAKQALATDGQLSDEELRSLARFPLENPNPVLRISINGKILFANEPGHVLLNHWNRVIGETVPADWQNLVSAYFSSNTEQNIQVKTKDRIFSFEIIPIPDAGYVNVYGHDITKHKLGERQTEALLDDLERTNNELKNFAYIVSHDLKAPLRGISSLADWIVEDYADVLDDAGRKQLELLIQNTRRMHHLIEGILAYSRLGREKPVPVLANCEDIVNQVIKSLAKPDTIKIRIEEDLPTVIYHKTHLQQIFQNLIGNAIKYLGKPSGEIIVSSVDCGKFQEFCVRDNGVGIEQRHFERIFKIFQALQPSKVEESTGIGLALVKKIVENHGGEIRVESTIGQGSSFFFTVPKTLKIRGNRYEK